MARLRPLTLAGGQIKEITDADALTGGTPWLGKVMQWSHCTGLLGQGSGNDWSNYVSNGALVNVTYPDVPDRLGVVQINTTPTAAASARAMAQSYINSHYAKPGIEQAVLGIVRPVNLLFDGTLTGELFVGMASGALLSASTAAIGIRSRNGGNWTFVCRSGGAETTRDLGTSAPLGTWITLEVRFTTTSARALVNGIDGGTPITTNIPTAALYALIGASKTVATAVTSAPAIQVDVAAYYEV